MKNIDSKTHVRGESIYVDDVAVLEGTLYASVFSSPIAHGRITNLNLEEAKEIKGVVRILTKDDIQGENQIGGIIPDEPLLAVEKVHYQGQPIAIVVAESETIAREAVEKITVDIYPLPIITDPREAQKKGELIIPPRTFEQGEIENSWKDCDHIYEGKVEIGGQEQLYIETQGAYAIPIENGNIKIISSTQGPTAVQRAASKVLGVGMHSIEVEVRRLGGGFGGKEDQATPWAVMAALAVKHLNKPVKYVLHRMDDMKMTGKRHPYSADYKIGLDENLKILCYDVTFFQNAGAVADLSPAVMERTLFHANNTYYVPNLKATAYSCRTNLPPNTAFRGFGGPQGMFVIESAINKAAQELNIKAEQIQEANLLVDGDTFQYGQEAKSAKAVSCWKDSKKRFEWEKLHEEVAEFNKNNKNKKKGLAVMPICFGISFTKIMLNQARALCHVYTDGSVGVSTAAVEMGQGVNTKMLQVAANIFSINPEKVRIETTNTTRIANTSPTAASAAADLNGKALEKACKIIIERLKYVAADIVKADRTSISFYQGFVYNYGSKTNITWEEVVWKAYEQRISLSEHAHYATPDIGFDTKKEKGEPFAYHVYGNAVTCVTLDCLRGTYEFDYVKIVHDYGMSMSPTIDKGQTEGGLVQGMGWMTMEDLSYDENGKLLSNALSTYKVPDIYSVPKEIDVHFHENLGHKKAVFRSKAIGEPPLMYGIGAYFAIHNAVKSYNKNASLPFDAPFTPEKVLINLYENYEPIAEESESKEETESIVSE